MTENELLFRAPLEAALDHALAHVQGGDSASVAATKSLGELRDALDVPLHDSGLPAADIINQLAAAVEGGLLGSAGGRFFGWVIGGSLPSALAADWLTSAWDQNAGLYACAPAAAVVEEVVGKWLKELLRVPAGASFALVTGCQMAHVTCLLAARHALLAKRGWDVEQAGLYGAPPIRILSSTEYHGTVKRAARFLGMGESNLITLPVDADGRLVRGDLERALEANADSPFLLVLQAGELNLGAFDDFATLIPIAKQYGAWVHIDGAFGLWAAASPRYKHFLDGAELADSWATDGHKWLNVPYDCGYAFVNDVAAHRAALSHRAAYLTHGADARDQLDWNPEHSRRARGFATYAALRELGRSGVAGLVDRCCEHAHALVVRIGSLPSAEVLWEPTLNQGLVRFLDQRPGAVDADHDARTEQVMAGILKSGEAFFTGTTWRGRRVMRVSVCNWQTSADDVERIVRAVAGVLER
jgi:glutamate/tyrosine decarboxylase-like PLP-dependent enzyme